MLIWQVEAFGLLKVEQGCLRLLSLDQIGHECGPCVRNTPLVLVQDQPPCMEASKLGAAYALARSSDKFLKITPQRQMEDATLVAGLLARRRELIDLNADCVSANRAPSSGIGVLFTPKPQRRRTRTLPCALMPVVTHRMPADARLPFSHRRRHSEADPDGTELPCVNEAKIEAVRLAGGLMRDHPEGFLTHHDWSIKVTDPLGLHLFSYTFFATEAPALAGQPRI